MMRHATSFRRDETGATAIEYALIAGLASISIFVGAELVGGNLTELYQLVVKAFADVG